MELENHEQLLIKCLFLHCPVPQFALKLYHVYPSSQLVLYITQSQFLNKQVSRDLNFNTKTCTCHTLLTTRLFTFITVISEFCQSCPIQDL